MVAPRGVYGAAAIGMGGCSYGDDDGGCNHSGNGGW